MNIRWSILVQIWMTCCKIVKYGINLGGLKGFKNDLVAVIYFIFCVVSLCHHFHVSLHVLLYCFLSEVSVYWWHLVTMTEIRHQWSLTDTPYDEYFIDAIRAINKMTALVQLKIFTALKGTLHYLFWDLKKNMQLVKRVSTSTSDWEQILSFFMWAQ